jgi:lysophospholipase L1-like esterase
VTKATGTKVAGVTSPSIVSGLTNGTAYYFVVTAVNIFSFESAESTQVSTTPTPAPPPSPPTGVSATAGYGLATINWSPVVGATSYNIYYSTTSPVTKASPTKITGVTTIPKAATGLIIGTTYYFVVTAVNSSGESALSSQVSVIPSAEYIAVGDSITEGEFDDILSDGIGYEPILANLLAATIANEGVGGVKSAYGVANISSTLSKYPSAKYFLVLYGTNDSDPAGPTVPSGLGLNPGDDGYDGSYKDNMQKIISAIKAAEKLPYLAKVLYIPFIPPDTSRDTTIQEYNAVIDDLVVANGISVTPPDFYTYFKNHQGEFADGLHPNGVGYQSMANLWDIALP